MRRPAFAARPARAFHHHEGLRATPAPAPAAASTPACAPTSAFARSLPPLHCVAAADVPPTPWKNGGGRTRELLRLPPDAKDDWALRISLADIDADGPFSPFAGVQRWFAVLEGAGVRLSWHDAEGTPRRLVAQTAAAPPLRFDGADAPDCRLLDGPTRDLNLMTREGAAAAMLVPATFDKPCAWADGLRGVFALRPLKLLRGHGAGRTPPGDAVALPLGAHTLAWSDGADTSTWWLAPPTAFEPASAHTAVPAYWIVAKSDAAPPERRS